MAVNSERDVRLESFHLEICHGKIVPENAKFMETVCLVFSGVLYSRMYWAVERGMPQAQVHFQHHSPVAKD